jgi:hypothetical protein
MSVHKITPFLSDIKTFFNKSDMSKAMQNISSILSSVKMTERSTICVESKQNNIYKLLTVFQCLLLFPCFGIKNIFRSQSEGTLQSLIAAHKDVFYRFMANPNVNWRKAMWHISLQLWSKVCVRTDHVVHDTCLIIDDTDHEKTGRRIEKIGRVHSHLAHKAVLGFKCLTLAITDGISQMVLDFDIVGEKGKNKKYGMSDKELSLRKVNKHDSKTLAERETAYDKSKLELTMDLIRRAISHNIHFRYVLADSWFTCQDIVRFIHRRHVKCDWLGMIKVGDNSRTRYQVGNRNMTAPELVKQGKKLKLKRYSKKLKCQYIVYDAVFGGVSVRIFLVRRTDHGQWNGLLTTDTKMDFLKAWEIYSRRWALEVVYKECKTYLGFGKCQSTSFSAQIAASTICCLQYNILSVAKRFSDYETIGELFREATKETLQLSVTQQIWGIIQELVNAIAEAFGLLDEEIYDAIIYRSEEMAHIFKFYNLKSAS